VQEAEIRSFDATLRRIDETEPAERHARPLEPFPAGQKGALRLGGLGQLGGRALEVAWPWTRPATRALALDGLRDGSVTPWGDGSGRWRKLTFTTPERIRESPEGELWRTPNGVLMIFHYDSREGVASAVEYCRDGDFRPVDLPGWDPYDVPVPQGWGGADRIARFLSTYAERGHAPHDVAQARQIAERTGLPLPEVASACFGYPFFFGMEADRGRWPRDVLDLYTDPATGERAKGKPPRSYWLDRTMRHHLMPDDPEELWTTGLAVDRVVEWWHAHGARSRYNQPDT
jgi:hypothetical protein